MGSGRAPWPPGEVSTVGSLGGGGVWAVDDPIGLIIETIMNRVTHIYRIRQNLCFIFYSFPWLEIKDTRDMKLSKLKFLPDSALPPNPAFEELNNIIKYHFSSTFSEFSVDFVQLSPFDENILSHLVNPVYFMS